MSRKFMVSLCAGFTVSLCGIASAQTQTCTDPSQVRRDTAESRPIVTLVPAGRMKDQHLVDAWVYGVSDLRSYQLKVASSGGRKGKLELAGIVVNRQRQDYVFGTAQAITAESVFSSHVAAVAYESGQRVEGWSYLATFIFRPTPDAEGDFPVRIVATENTLLADSRNELIDFVIGPEAVVVIGRPLTADRATKHATRKQSQ